MGFCIRYMDMCYRVAGFGLHAIEKAKLHCEGYLFNPRGYREEVALRCFGASVEYGPRLSEIIHFNGSTLCVAINGYVLSPEGDEYVQLLRDGFPNCTAFMDARTGERICSSVSILFRQGYSRFADPIRCDAERLADEFSLCEQAESLGFRGIDEAAQNIAPYVPEGIRELCRYLQIFRDPSTVLSLRPMYFCYRRNNVEKLPSSLQRVAI